ncbi:MAG TPA: iron-containing alcohol dehydrogenase [Bacteroidales bacterium]|nr:iron-containing alcohol dehydrogenase [Bacteroidales bacterium]HNR42071.1 iron-containing alcohol dehydrogenase [Bacteroidales bacterium]HPV15734.1 iron-containing alcohol dehydrogenase [Bacteroidales bacterium]HQG75909.1 iron-containing alcohol dehydrogenase [Bacteroidales bacterium]
MENFEFYNPVRVFFGRGQISKIAGQIPAGSRVMLIYGGGSIFRNGVYEQTMEALKRFEVTEFGGIEPNPTYETSMRAVEVIREKKIDFLLAAGGGSVIDATKFIAAATLYTFGDPWNILAKKMPVMRALPFGAILTLPATGSEMNRNSVISRRSTAEKLGFGSPFTYPKFSVLLPDAAGTLPPAQVANGIVDAFVHVMEQYLTYPVNAPIQDRFAEAILLTLIEEGPKAYRNPADYEAMSNLMWSATMALNGLIACGVPEDWSVHDIGHELTAFHGIDHARTLAIVQPGLWKALREEKKEKLLQYGERVWKITEGSTDEKVDAAIEKTVEFFESLGIKTRLSEYGVGQDTIDKIVARFRERNWINLGDRGLTTPEVTKETLEHQL